MKSGGASRARPAPHEASQNALVKPGMATG